MKYKIYKLLINDIVIYIGQTITSLRKRKLGWYPNIPNEILKQSKIEIIEETDDLSRERYWIKYYRDLGCELYNRNNGSGLDYKEYRVINKESIKLNLRKSRLKNIDSNKDKKKEYMKNYRILNKEKLKEYKKEYRLKKKLSIDNKNDYKG